MITADLLETIPLFSSLTSAQREHIADRAADISLQTGDWLIQEGELPSFFVLLSGSLDVLKNVNDSEMVINHYEPGDYFGELPLLLGSTSVASLRAHEPSRALRIEPADFHTSVIGIPSISRELLKKMAMRVELLQQLNIDSNPTPVRIVGYRWDPQCHDIRDFLARNRVAFEWLEPTDPDAQAIIQASGALDVCPLVVLPDESILVTPSRRTLAEKLGLQTTPALNTYDVVIIGAGPAGLAAAVYGASEGLTTLLIDREAPGGQAGTSSRIENYLGFPSGLSGDELSRRAWQQAHRFGAEFLVARHVRGITPGKGEHMILLDGEEQIAARSVVIATGVSWRRLSTTGMDALVGRGIYYGAARTEAQGTRGKDIYLVGGGNSAGQAALNFANYARSVTILVRGSTLSSTMSHYLIDQLATKANISVWPYSEVVAAHGDKHLQSIVVHNRQTQSDQTLSTDALFIFIGADAQVEWLPPAISRDDRGYILTGRDILADPQAASLWPLTRDPYLLETSTPGIFAAGDVRHGSIKRVASGVGEGSMSISFIHQYLATDV